MVSIRLSLTETYVQNQLAASVKSLLHTSKQYKVEVPWCCCNNDMKSLQKMQKDKIFIENFICAKTEKMAKVYKMAMCVFSWPAHLKKWPNFSKLAMKWPIWQPWYWYYTIHRLWRHGTEGWNDPSENAQWNDCAMCNLFQVYEQARRQDLAAGGHIFKILYWMYTATREQTWNGGHRFQIGGRVPLAPHWRGSCVWFLEISRKAFRISLSVSSSRFKVVYGYPYPVANSLSFRISNRQTR